MLVSKDEMTEAKFSYACASIRVALASFEEICELYGGIDGELLDTLEECRAAIGKLMGL